MLKISLFTSLTNIFFFSWYSQILPNYQTICYIYYLAINFLLLLHSSHFINLGTHTCFVPTCYPVLSLTLVPNFHFYTEQLFHPIINSSTITQLYVYYPITLSTQTMLPIYTAITYSYLYLLYILLSTQASLHLYLSANQFY